MIIPFDGFAFCDLSRDCRPTFYFSVLAHKTIDKFFCFARLQALFPRMRTVRRPAAPERTGADYRDNNKTKWSEKICQSV